MGLIQLRLRALLLSVVLLIPCFWQRRIQAGDLSSHIYNSWLAQQIELGKAPGLVIAPMSTNVMFDLMLGWLFRVAGPEPAMQQPSASRSSKSAEVLSVVTRRQVGGAVGSAPVGTAVSPAKV